MFVSTLTEQPIGATITILVIAVGSQIMDAIPQLAAIHTYLPTHYWLSFVDLFRNPILWRDIERGLLLQAVFVAVFLGAAWALFTTKDVTS